MSSQLRRGLLNLVKMNLRQFGTSCRPYNMSNNGIYMNIHRSVVPKQTSSPILRQMSYDNTNKVHNKIHDLITKSKQKVFVFMKGNPSKPLCKYSGIVVQILDTHGVKYDSADVLKDSEIRQEIKSYSDSPTIPQVFVNGSFVGGSDILQQMHESGELKKLLGEAGKPDEIDNELKPLDGRPEEEKVPEEEYPLSSLTRNELVQELPIMSLDVDRRIKKVEKKGSFTTDIFTGSYDHDFLTYPEPLSSRIENIQLKEQANMVKQLWPQIWNDNLQLQKFNFFNLFQLSVTEMMTIFEAIGASTRDCYETNIPSNINDHDMIPQNQLLVTRSIISLITRNCLTYWPMHKSDNHKMKEFLPKKHILHGGASVEESNKLYPPVGFCWSEQMPELGSLPPQEWQSTGLYGGKDVGHYLVKGRKTKVLFDDSLEHYLVYFRDKLLSEKYDSACPADEPNPASDPFVACCLFHKSELKFSDVYQDSAGFRYTDVDFDTTLPEDRVVFPAKRVDTTAVNIKALGQLATSSVTLGLLKDTVRRNYIYLIDCKRGLLDCDIIERKMASITSKIFALESMLYFIAGMFDGLESGFDAHMEATILKILTNDFAFEILRDLQQMCGSDLFILSRLQDQINVYDSFLDGNIHNRLYLATMGVIWFARSKNMHLNQLRMAPWYPGYFLKSMLKENVETHDWMTLNADIYGNLHPSLKEAAVNLEFLIKRIKFAAENICMKYGADVTGAQTSLYQLSQLSIDTFMLTAMCARASKSYSNGSRNSELDVAITTSFSTDLARKVKLYMEEITTTPFSALNNRSKIINQLNLKYGGYYAESPLDPNI